MKDNELDQLLAEFRANEPSDLQIQKWKKAVHGERVFRYPVKKPWIQCMAACFIGFVIGGLLFGFKESTIQWQKLSKSEIDSATIEYIFTKIN